MRCLRDVAYAVFNRPAPSGSNAPMPVEMTSVIAARGSRRGIRQMRTGCCLHHSVNRQEPRTDGRHEIRSSLETAHA